MHRQPRREHEERHDREPAAATRHVSVRLEEEVVVLHARHGDRGRARRRRRCRVERDWHGIGVGHADVAAPLEAEGEEKGGQDGAEEDGGVAERVGGHRNLGGTSGASCSRTWAAWWTAMSLRRSTISDWRARRVARLSSTWDLSWDISVRHVPIWTPPENRFIPTAPRPPTPLTRPNHASALTNRMLDA